MRGRTGNASPPSGINTGSDTCPAVQAQPALPHTSRLRTPNCQLGKEVPGFTGDFNTGQRKPTPVSVVHSNDCQLSLGQPLSHSTQGLPSCDTADSPHLPAGAVPGLPRARLLVCGLRQGARTGTGATTQAAGKRSASTANHFSSC